MENTLALQAEGRIQRMVDLLNTRTETANALVNVALNSYRSSMHVLDITSLLRIASLNVFIKTERNNTGINVFAPVSQEFMNLVKNYETLTKEFGEVSTRFVSLLIEHVKHIRKFKHFVLAASAVAVQDLIAVSGTTSDLDALELFMHGRAERFRGHDVVRTRLLGYTPIQRSMVSTIIDELAGIRKLYLQLKSIDKQLSNLSNVGEYAAHLAKIEASRLAGREDLIAAFDEIHELLNQSLAELETMRSRFRRAEESVSALDWGESS